MPTSTKNRTKQKSKYMQRRKPSMYARMQMNAGPQQSGHCSYEHLGIGLSALQTVQADKGENKQQSAGYRAFKASQGASHRSCSKTLLPSSFCSHFTG